MQRSSVDLPAPDGPMMQTTSPRGTDIDTSVSTSSGPNDFQIRSSRTIGSVPLLADKLTAWPSRNCCRSRLQERPGASDRCAILQGRLTSRNCWDHDWYIGRPSAPGTPADGSSGA